MKVDLTKIANTFLRASLSKRWCQQSQIASNMEITIRRNHESGHTKLKWIESLPFNNRIEVQQGPSSNKNQMAEQESKICEKFRNGVVNALNARSVIQCSSLAIVSTSHCIGFVSALRCNEFSKINLRESSSRILNRLENRWHFGDERNSVALRFYYLPEIRNETGPCRPVTACLK